VLRRWKEAESPDHLCALERAIGLLDIQRDRLKQTRRVFVRREGGAQGAVVEGEGAGLVPALGTGRVSTRDADREPIRSQLGRMLARGAYGLQDLQTPDRREFLLGSGDTPALSPCRRDPVAGLRERDHVSAGTQPLEQVIERVRRRAKARMTRDPELHPSRVSGRGDTPPRYCGATTRRERHVRLGRAQDANSGRWDGA